MAGGFYLTHYIGRGTYRDPYRPFADDAESFSSIDLRKPGNVDGPAFLWSPDPINHPRIVKIGEHARESPLSIRRLESLLHAIIATVPQRADFGETIFRLLRNPAANMLGCNPLTRGHRRQSYDCWLGSLLYSEPARWLHSSQIYSDDFEDGSFAGVWQDVAGDWIEANGQLKCDSTVTQYTATVIYYLAPFDTDDHFSEMEYDRIEDFTQTSTVRALVRKADDQIQTYYGFSAKVVDGDAELFYTNAGVFSTIGAQVTGLGILNSGDLIRCEVDGSTLKGLINGTPIVTETDMNLVGNFHAGIGSYNRLEPYRDVWFESWNGADLAPALSPPVNTALPVVTGVTEVGSTLSTTDGTWDGNPEPTYSYQWQSGAQAGGGDMSDINAATENFYLLTPSEQTLYVRCVVTGANSEEPGGVPANSNIEGPINIGQSLPTPPVTGLIGKWFPSQDTAGNGTGTLFDLSARSNDGVLTSATWVADTASGGTRAIEFDSPGDGVACPNPTMGDVFTISLWVYLNSSKQGTWQPFVNQYQAGITGRFLFMYESAADTIFISLGTSASGNPISILDGWHHIAFTRDGPRWRWWVDGVLNRDEYDESSVQTAQVPMEIGNYLGDQLDGRFDSVLVFDNVITDEDIQFLATSRAADEQGSEVPPENTDPPVVTGVTEVGSTLSTTDGTWTGEPTPTYSYQWQSGIQAGGGDMSNIVGATANTYLLTASEETLYIRCVVTATNSEAPGGVPANSNIVGPITASTADVNVTTLPGQTDTLGQAPIAISDVNITSSTGQTDTTGLAPSPSTDSNVSVAPELGQTDTIGLVPVPMVVAWPIVAGLGQTDTIGLAAIPDTSSAGGGIGNELAWYSPSIDDSPNDLTNNNNDGTYLGGMATIANTSVPGGGTRAYEFDAVNDYVNVPDDPSLTVNTAVSVSAWFRVDESKSGNQGIITRSNATDQGWALFVAGSNSNRALNFGVVTAGFNVVSTTGAFVLGTWVHVVATFDSATTTGILYINGIEQTPKTNFPAGIVAPTSMPMQLGTLNTTQRMGGLIDDARLWPRVVTQSEVTELWNGGRGYLRSTDIIIESGLGQTDTAGLVPALFIDGSVLVETGIGQTDTIGSVPSLGINGNIALATNIGQTITAGFAPDVQVGGNVAVTAGLGQSVTLASQPNVIVDFGGSIATNTGQTITQGLQPSVASTSQAFITTNLGQSITQGLAPSVFVDGSITVSTNTGLSVTIGLVPVVSTTILKLGSHSVLNVGAGKFTVLKTGQ